MELTVSPRSFATASKRWCSSSLSLSVMTRSLDVTQDRIADIFWLVNVLVLVSLSACAGWARSGRLVDQPCLHVGVRPASDAAGNWAVTVQVTTDWPARCRRRADAGD